MWNIVIYLPECISHLSFTSRWSNFNINLTKFLDFQSSGNIFDISSDADGHGCWFEIKKYLNTFCITTKCVAAFLGLLIRTTVVCVLPCDLLSVHADSYPASCSCRRCPWWSRCAVEPRGVSCPCTSRWSSQSRWAASCRGSPPRRRGPSTSVEGRNITLSPRRSCQLILTSVFYSSF